MAIALENTDSFGTDGAGTFGLTLSFTPTQGNKLLLAISQYTNSLITRIETDGVVWSFVQSKSNSGDSLGVFTEHWIGDVVDVAPGTNLDILRPAIFSNAAVAVHEVSGLKEHWPIDQVSGIAAQATPADTGQAGIPFNPESYYFGSLAGSSSAGGTIPGAPTNGFTTREEDEGPDADTTIGHRITSFDKIVASASSAYSRLAYGGATRWGGMMTTVRGDNEAAKPIVLVQKAELALTTNPDTVSLPGAPQDDSTILMMIALNLGQSVVGITQVGVTSWVKDASVTHSSNNIRVEIWRSTQTLSASADIVVEVSGTSNVNVFVHEYSGILEAPLDESATNEGGAAAISTGQTAAIDSPNQLVVGLVAQLNPTALFQNAPGFFREDQAAVSTFYATAVFVNDESHKSLPYEVAADSGVTGYWAGCVATYRSDAVAATEGPAVGIYSAEANQGGGAVPVGSGSFSEFAGVSGGFKAGHRHLILATARVQNKNGATAIRLNISGTGHDESKATLFSVAIVERAMPWSVARVATLSETDNVIVELRHVSGVIGQVRQINLVIIDLDSVNLFKGADWFHEEDVVIQADMDTTFANNAGASVTFTPDGTSSYLAIGHARMSAVAATPTANENVMRIRDITNGATLAQGGWHKTSAGDAPDWAFNVMAVIEAPAASALNLDIEMIGGGGGDGWQHEESSITIIRLDAFASSGFNHNQALAESSPDSVLPPAADAVLAQSQFPYAPDSAGEVITLAYAEADNVASDANGIASQAQLSGVKRSLWDTENETLGGVVVVADEVNACNYNTNNADTRIPTFGVSRRTRLTPAAKTAQWFNAGVAGNASVIERAALACFGSLAKPTPTQTPPPTPVAAPTVTTVLQEKPAGQHEEEAFDNQLEQFKPGVV